MYSGLFDKLLDLPRELLDPQRETRRRTKLKRKKQVMEDKAVECLSELVKKGMLGINEEH